MEKRSGGFDGLSIWYSRVWPRRTITHDFGFVRSCHDLKTRVHPFHELANARFFRGSSNRANRFSISHVFHTTILHVVAMNGCSTCRAAQRKPMSSRATAVLATHRDFTLLNLWNRLYSRFWAFHAMAITSAETAFCRSRRIRLHRGGAAYFHPAEMRAFRTC